MARDLKELSKMFKAIRDDLPNFYDETLKEVGAAFLSYVIPLTPVEENGTYEIGDKKYYISGGALRRGWIGETKAGDTPTPSDIEGYVESLSTVNYHITLANTIYYAMYANYGHKQQPGRYVPRLGKTLKKSWVPGLHFKERAENQLQPHLAQIYDRKLREFYDKWNKD